MQMKKWFEHRKLNNKRALEENLRESLYNLGVSGKVFLIQDLNAIEDTLASDKITNNPIEYGENSLTDK